MAFRPRQPNEDLGAYLRAKQQYELQTTGRSGVDFGTPVPQSVAPQSRTVMALNPTEQRLQEMGLLDRYRQIQAQPSVSQPITPPVAPSEPITSVPGPEMNETTGDPQLDELVPVLRSYVDQLLAQNKTINPNVKITTEKLAEFMSIAGREIDPYYSTQFKLAKDTFLKDLGYGTEDILRFEQDTERKYGQQLRQLGEAKAEQGFALSGIRRREESELAQETQQQLEERRRTLSRAAESTAGQFAQQYGGQAMPTPTITQAPRVLSGIGTFERPQGVSPLYNLSNEVYDNLVGAKQYEQEAEKRRRASELEQSYRIKEENRLLSEIQ